MADAYRIIMQPEAYDDMEGSYVYIERDAPESAQQWAVGLLEAINSLETFPSRCLLAPEDKILRGFIRAMRCAVRVRRAVWFSGGGCRE
jgi:plasmid stabilization system protein ParE